MQQQKLTPEQYSANLKQNLFSITGELTSRVGSVIDELMMQMVNQGKNSEFLTEELNRLKDILKKHDISFERVPPKTTPENLPSNINKSKRK